MSNKAIAVLLPGLGVLLSSRSPAVAAELHYVHAALEAQVSFVLPGEPDSLDRCDADLTSGGGFPGCLISGFDTGHGIAVQEHAGVGEWYESRCEVGVRPGGMGGRLADATSSR